jgi:RNA polymerase sigma factor (sigma-70 family)
MAFPDTHLSLICRIVATGDAASWEQFVANYWRATSRFAMRLGNLQWSDAEDVSSQVFEILYRKSLLESWLSRPEARFKTLLCTVVRNVVQNTVRSQRTAARHAAEQFRQAQDLGDPATHHDLDLFYAIWAEELLRTAVQSLMTDYHREGKGDYFRVLHGRIGERMAVKEIAEQLDLKPTDVENYLRNARKRLADRIEQLVRKEASYYTDLSELDTEFQHEWQRLADVLQQQGGLEECIRNALNSKAMGRQA